MSGRVVIVTGGTKGIGFAIARQFLLSHDTVIVCSSHAVNGTKALEAFAEEHLTGCVAKVLDVSDVAAIKAFFNTIAAEHGAIDVMVNNAGVQYPMPVREVTEAVWDTTVDTNLKGMFFCSQEASKLLKRGGSIINISSVQAQFIADGQSVYASTKAAIVQLTRCLAKEWAKDGIRVNCVAPGSIPTDINREYYSNPDNLARTRNRIPMGRQGEPSEVAKTVWFLASDDASYITGQTLFVDGGWLLV